ncbi:hypothetical protein OHB04_02340 [Streptomyces sp. NBC_01775]|uniref:hypothetical protein n=1 Tax=Streptomyces sp. NBC_01775 TaxID=2975939 RepID=UPI002DD79FA0|nr:hypothetical protein [Streptomyces sp. NBC_01775]WSB74732.1 hypothetical protein OHB04_02340 [Streptomyces sp. NBC_01775]
MGGPLKKYTVTTASGVETVMKLNEADARFHRVGDCRSEPSGEEQEAAPEKPQAKKRAVSNKSRAAADKGGAGGGDD